MVAEIQQLRSDLEKSDALEVKLREARQDELTNAVIVLCGKGFTPEQRKAYIKDRISALKEPSENV